MATAPTDLPFREETFRDDFTFRNSPETVRPAPFPFDQDEYMYAVNMELPPDGRTGTAFEQPIDVDEHYVAEMRDRALVLDEDPLRTWDDPQAYDAQAKKLVSMFAENFAQYDEHIDDDVRAIALG